VLGQGGLLKQPTGRVVQKALEAELTEHLGYAKYDNAGDSRNGHSEKTVFKACHIFCINESPGISTPIPSSLFHETVFCNSLCHKELW
jgi:hypothetical protein